MFFMPRCVYLQPDKGCSWVWAQRGSKWIGPNVVLRTMEWSLPFRGLPCRGRHHETIEFERSLVFCFEASVVGVHMNTKPLPFYAIFHAHDKMKKMWWRSLKPTWSCHQKVPLFFLLKLNLCVKISHNAGQRTPDSWALFPSSTSQAPIMVGPSSSHGWCSQNCPDFLSHLWHHSK